MKESKFRPIALLVTLTMVMMFAITPIVSKASAPADAVPVLIPLSEALKTAQEQNSALIPIDISLETETGRNYYTVEMLAQDGSTTEVYVDAYTGMIIDEIAASTAEQDGNANGVDTEDTNDQDQVSDINNDQDNHASQDSNLTVIVNINRGSMDNNNSEEQGNFESQNEDNDMNENADEMLMFSSVKITMLQAIETAKSAVSDAEVTEVSLDGENGTLVYTVKLLSKNGIKSEVPIDSITGSIIALSEGNVEHED